MGGSESVEFMVPTDAGEDDVAHCAELRLRGQRRTGDVPGLP